MPGVDGAGGADGESPMNSGVPTVRNPSAVKCDIFSDEMRLINKEKSMNLEGRRHRRGAIIGIGAAATLLLAVCARQALGLTQDAVNFPDGYDAVTVAPQSHKVIFENALVRVLQVTMPAPGKTEPMHHHRWPSFWLDWDTGGKSPHIRYHQPGGVVRDIPSTESPATMGHWTVHWMKPEPMHAIETLEDFSSPNEPSAVRVEIKFQP